MSTLKSNPAISFVVSPYFSPTKSHRSRKTKTSTLASQSIAHDNAMNNYKDDLNENYKESCGLQTKLVYLEQLKPRLIQEEVAADTWKVLIAVTLLNKTSGKLAIPAFRDIMAKWPNPFELSRADRRELVDIIQHLGTQNRRAERLIALSETYIREPPSIYDMRRSKRSPSPRKSSKFFTSSYTGIYPATPISHLPGTGPYALDSYRIFSSQYDHPGSEEWKNVFPSDKELIRFLKWKWAVVEHMEWSPTKGPIRPIGEKYISSLIEELDTGNVGCHSLRVVQIHGEALVRLGV